MEEEQDKILKNGFRRLFEPEVRHRLECLNGLLYPKFREVSMIILAYETIRTPDYLDIYKLTQMDRDYKGLINDIDYKYLCDRGLPILDSKMSMEEIILGLSDMPEIALKLCNSYYFKDIDTKISIKLDKDKLSNYGYDKFSINIIKDRFHRKDHLLNYEFILYNYIELLNFTEDNDEKECIQYCLNTLFNRWHSCSEFSYIHYYPIVNINTKLKYDLYNMLRDKFKNLTYSDLRFTLYSKYTFMGGYKQYNRIFIENKVEYTPSDCNIFPLCEYVESFCNIASDNHDSPSHYIILNHNDKRAITADTIPIYYK